MKTPSDDVKSDPSIDDKPNGVVSKKVLIAGGSGFIGCNLALMLKKQGYSVSVIGRDCAKIERSMPSVVALSWSDLGDSDSQLLDFDLIINLAGHSISSGRWTKKNKRRLIDSRINTVNKLVDYCAQAQFTGVFINASAIGYYGSQGDQVLTENSTPCDSFSHQLCAAWESALKPLDQNPSIRLCVARFGVVLSTSGGAFSQMTLPFKAKVAMQNGNGQQWFSWVDLNDAVSALLFLAENDKALGVFNVSSPQPLTNHALTQLLAEHYRTVCGFNAPAGLLKVAMGEMADELLLASQRVVPKKLQDLGFTFSYEDFSVWLKSL